MWRWRNYFIFLVSFQRQSWAGKLQCLYLHLISVFLYLLPLSPSPCSLNAEHYLWSQLVDVKFAVTSNSVLPQSAILSPLPYSFLVCQTCVPWRKVIEEPVQNLLPNCRRWGADNCWAFLRCCPPRFKTLQDRALFPLQRSVPQSVLLLPADFQCEIPIAWIQCWPFMWTMASNSISFLCISFCTVPLYTLCR